MPLKDITKSTQDFKSQIERLVKDNLEYYKLLGFKTVTKSAASLIKIFIVGLACLLIVLFLSLAAGFALGSYWGNEAYGFLAMAGIILLLLILFILTRKYTVDRIVLKHFSNMFNDTESNEKSI